ncbi:unnamed protein product [Peniophora sp. CBMAI 1063]|nr:unnamed protein product [Peniophora sp. CBMAI 1063]
MLLQQAPTISKRYSEQYHDLELMVHRLDRRSAHISQFLAFTAHPMYQRRDYLGYVRHFIRKLYTIRFTLSPSMDVSLGLDLAGLHRLLARQPQTTRAKKRRRPKFTFGQDEDQDWADGDVRDVQSGLSRRLRVLPEALQQNVMRNELRFVFPLCCLRKNRPRYEHAELRVRYTQPGQPATPGPGEVFVDTGRILDTFSKDLILIALPSPHKNTLYVELKHFASGQPDFAPANDKPNGRKSQFATPPTAASFTAGSGRRSTIRASPTWSAWLRSFPAMAADSCRTCDSWLRASRTTASAAARVWYCPIVAYAE